ncbi:hypothetical protein ABW19_dt0202114 [Dactylella cylindrospora]|nr:hypothetical protein ABW19_dt0202114 [Dactylella cylindrospora]
MDTLPQLARVLEARRRQGNHLKNNKPDRLDKKEVRETGFRYEYFGDQLYTRTEHGKDISYAKHLYSIYTNFYRCSMVPPSISLRQLKTTAEDRIEELDYNLLIIAHFENHGPEYHPEIDMLRWKISYYQQTLEDIQRFIEMHDEATLYVKEPVGENCELDNEDSLED